MASLIHCCWFGGKKPALVQTCLASWKRFEPRARILEWNEANAACEDSVYYRAAIAARKWAFAADYVRLRKLYEMGGVYFDTDIELKTPVVEELSQARVTLGFEKNCVQAGVIASEPRHPLIGRLLESYDSRVDIGLSGKEPQTIVNRLTDLLVDNYGLRSPFGEQQLREGVRILPANRLLVDNGDGQSLAVHHYAASWKTGFDADAFAREVFYYCNWRAAPIGFRLKERLKMALQFHFPRVYRVIRDREGR